MNYPLRIAMAGGSIALMLAITLTAASGQDSQPAAASGDADAGKEAFLSAGCAGCHGPSGRGELGPRVMPLDKTFEAFEQLVRHPTGTMPAFPEAALSAHQLTDIYAFLHPAPKADASTPAEPSAPTAVEKPVTADAPAASKVESPAPPQTGSIAPDEKPGNAENGKKLFSSSGCGECHGAEGQGGAAGPKLGPPVMAFPAFVAELRHPHGKMPPFTAKTISDAEVADLYAFVKTLAAPADAASIPLPKK